MQVIPHTILGQSFLFAAQKVVFWESKSILILSDLHLGKTTHFRKAGVAVPHQLLKEDLHKLWHCIQYFNPKQIIVVGDFFHSTHNNEHELFVKWRNSILHIPFTLIAGNHDILQDSWYKKSNIDLVTNVLTIDDFAFIHDPKEESNSAFTFYGHLHPAIHIKGLGRQSLRVPCFHITENYCVLPAFGAFTGTATVKPNKADTVFAIVENEIIKIQ